MGHSRTLPRVLIYGTMHSGNLLRSRASLLPPHIPTRVAPTPLHVSMPSHAAIRHGRALKHRLTDCVCLSALPMSEFHTLTIPRYHLPHPHRNSTWLNPYVSHPNPYLIYVVLSSFLVFFWPLSGTQLYLTPWAETKQLIR